MFRSKLKWVPGKEVPFFNQGTYLGHHRNLPPTEDMTLGKRVWRTWIRQSFVLLFIRISSHCAQAPLGFLFLKPTAIGLILNRTILNNDYTWQSDFEECYQWVFYLLGTRNWKCNLRKDYFRATLSSKWEI